MQGSKHNDLMFTGSKSPRYIQRQHERRFLSAVAPLVWFVGLLGVGLIAYAVLQFFIGGRLPKLQFFLALPLLAFPLLHAAVMFARGHLGWDKKRRIPRHRSETRRHVKTRPIMPGTLRKRAPLQHYSAAKKR